VERAREAGVPYSPFGFESRWHLVFQLVVRGEWDEALALAEPEANPPTIAQALLDVFRLQIELARGGDVDARLRELRRFWAEEGLIPIHTSALEMRSAARRGDVDGVLAAYDDAVAILGRMWHPWFTARIRLAATALGALADQASDLSAEARPRLLERAEELHADGHVVLDRYRSPAGFWGPEGQAWTKRLDAEMLRLRWLIGDPPPPETLVATWREAEVLAGDFGDVHELARVRTALASILRSTGDASAARDVADRARETARALGATSLLDELRGLGEERPRQRSGGSTLTAREREILALVAAGRSNGEIGRQLFIATKTVSVHVSNILGKLGAASRTEAAAIARRNGLLS
jgi:DNA-binding CsgD family transcriptional regulator